MLPSDFSAVKQEREEEVAAGELVPEGDLATAEVSRGGEEKLAGAELSGVEIRADKQNSPAQQ